MPGVPGSRVLITLAVTAVAAGWFVFNAWFTLEWADEGQIVYPSWRTAEGALPYRDFQNIYGPTFFFLNGALLRLFGPDLAVLRLLIAAIKAASVGLAFHCTWRAAPLSLALGGGFLLTAILGAPWSALSTAYASYYAVALGMLGMAVLVGGSSRPRLACALAGLCIGVAATCKQTAGLYFFVALLVVLLADRPRANSASALPSWLTAWARPASLLAVLGFALLFPLPRGGLLHSLLLGGPLALLALRILLRERRDPPSADTAAESTLRIFAAAAGALVPPAAWVAYYGSAGALSSLVDDLVLSLPAAIEFFVPLSFHPGALLPWGLLAASFAAVHRARHTGSVGWRVAAVLLAGLLLVPVALGETQGWPEWTLSSLMLGALYLVPLLTAWGVPLVLAREPSGVPDAIFPAALATAGLLNLYPVADLFHVLPVLPIFLPAVVSLVSRALPPADAEAPVYRRTALAVLAAVLLVVSGPFLRVIRPHTIARSLDVARAPNIRRPPLDRHEAVRLLRHLDAPGRAHRPVFVPTGQAMVYFLSGRSSLFDAYEYVFYLMGYQLISAEEARRRIDSASVIARLEEQRPIIVQDEARSGILPEVLPEVGRYLAAHYRPTERIGRFRVLDRVEMLEAPQSAPTSELEVDEIQ